ncbi:MAG: hypothetical protein ACOH2H_16280 [Cypionkella sp.]
MTHWVKREINAWMAVLVFAIFYSLGPVFIGDYLGTIEGDLSPVVTTLIIDGRPERVAPDQASLGVMDSSPASNIDAHATKLRNCRFVRIEFFFGKRSGDSVPVHAEFLDPPKINRPGVLSWHDLIVGIPPALLDQVYGDVLHRCHAGWMTRTQFFTGKDAK